MTLVDILNWLFLPALGGLAWIARSVSRLETEVVQLKSEKTELFRQVNKHSEDIANVAKSVARIEGHLEK